MIKYEVRVYYPADKHWYLNGKRHFEHGPAIEYSNGAKEWHLNGKRLSEAEWKKQVSQPSCEGREIEIDGVTYVLKLKGQDDE